MEVLASTLIDALPLSLIHGICNVECKERMSVNKTALFEQSELVVFSE